MGRILHIRLATACGTMTRRNPKTIVSIKPFELCIDYRVRWEAIGEEIRKIKENEKG
jgi:hypothetical protein